MTIRKLDEKTQELKPIAEGFEALSQTDPNLVSQHAETNHAGRRLKNLLYIRGRLEDLMDSLDICPVCAGSGEDTRLDRRQHYPQTCLTCVGTGTKSGAEQKANKLKAVIEVSPENQRFRESIRQMRKQATDAE
jgi:hypothetical protein